MSIAKRRRYAVSAYVRFRPFTCEVLKCLGHDKLWWPGRTKALTSSPGLSRIHRVDAGSSSDLEPTHAARVRRRTAQRRRRAAPSPAAPSRTSSRAGPARKSPLMNASFGPSDSSSSKEQRHL